MVSWVRVTEVQVQLVLLMFTNNEVSCVVKQNQALLIHTRVYIYNLQSACVYVQLVPGQFGLFFRFELRFA